MALAVSTTADKGRIFRFADLDAQIQAEAERRQSTPNPKRRPRRRSDPGIPAAVRKEITSLARELNSQHRQLFIADPKLKERAARLLRSLLPPKRKRGRPGIDSVTKAIQLQARCRRQHPGERPDRIWKRVYPEAIPGYAGMSPVDQENAREVLRERVRWRLRDQKRRGRPALYRQGWQSVAPPSRGGRAPTIDPRPPGQ